MGFRVYRPLAVLKLTVGEMMKMEQVLQLGLMHAWALVCGVDEEGFKGSEDMVVGNIGTE